MIVPIRRLRLFVALFLLLSVALACQKIKPYVTGQVRHEYIRSAAMRQLIPAVIVLPVGYDDKINAGRQYPVVYLLHGYGGDYTQWQKIVDLPSLASRHETLLVCPDGGRDSWYVDSPVADSVRYETHLMKEVITQIDTSYRTLGARGRAITGLSMGGHGALRFLSLYSDSFVAAGSMSGILDLRSFPDSWNIAGRLGPFRQDSVRWAKNSAVSLVARLAGKNKGVIVDCGTDDFAIAVNRAFRDSAAVHQVAIRYKEDAGNHSREYWSRHLEPQLVFFENIFKKEAGQPR